MKGKPAATAIEGGVGDDCVPAHSVWRIKNLRSFFSVLSVGDTMRPFRIDAH